VVNGWYREKQWSDDAGNVSDSNVPPNSCAQVTAACGKKFSGWAGCDRDDCTTVSIGPVGVRYRMERI